MPKSRWVFALLCACVLALVACGGSDESGRVIHPFIGGGAGHSALGCDDSDADGISDDADGSSDSDQDGLPNRDDLDSDGDGIPDADERVVPGCEGPRDSDLDGEPDFLDLDSDNDGVPDAPNATTLDTDQDGAPNGRDTDDDGDGLLDAQEIGVDPLAPIDSDADSVPDYLDTDSDGDGVRDSALALEDLDGDGIADYLDDDADGDGLVDIIEVGADPLAPRDTDADGEPDYLDADSDGDGLADGVEDKNHDGNLDAGESSPTKLDTDGDAADDLVERAAATDANDAGENPQADGNFVFVVPFEADPTPKEATLDFASSIKRADVVFSMDTTGSMGGALEQLRTNLRSVIVPALAADIPDLGIAIASFEDFPLNPFGSVGDVPFELATPITTDPMVAQVGLNSLVIGFGGDVAESGVEALYQTATGAGVTYTGGSVAPFELGLRDGAVPIVIQISDAPNNSAETYMAVVPTAASRQAAQDALAAISAKVIAVRVGFDPSAVTDYLELVEESGAVVSPAAFGASGQCLTGIAGAPVPANADGQCPLLFDVDAAGAGLGSSVVDAVRALAGYAGLDMDGRPKNETGNVDSEGNEVDAIDAFLDRVVPNANPDPASGCASGLTLADRLGSDGVDDTFVEVSGNVRVCFDVIPKLNNVVRPSHSPQLFRARIDVYGDGLTVLDSRQVWFVVPPKPPAPGEVCSGLDSC